MLRSLLLLCALLAGAISIVEDTFVTYPEVQDVGIVTVEKNSIYSITNYPLVEIKGTVRIDGKWFVTGLDSPTNFIFSGSTISNNGLVVVRNIGKGRIELNSSEGFSNNGSFYVVNSMDRSQPYDFVATGNMNNKGSIYVITPESSPSRGQISFDTKSELESDGLVCSKNNDMHGPFPAEGGCLALHQSSGTFTVSPDILNEQYVYLADSSSSILFSGISQSSFAVTIFGFGGGNRIKIDQHIDWIDYNESTQFLTVGSLASGQIAQLQIGEGYDPKYIQQTSAGISYALPPPNKSVPRKCICNFQLPTVRSPPHQSASSLKVSSSEPTLSSQNREISSLEVSETSRLALRNSIPSKSSFLGDPSLPKTQKSAELPSATTLIPLKYHDASSFSTQTINTTVALTSCCNAVCCVKVVPTVTEIRAPVEGPTSLTSSTSAGASFSNASTKHEFVASESVRVRCGLLLLVSLIFNL